MARVLAKLPRPMPSDFWPDMEIDGELITGSYAGLQLTITDPARVGELRRALWLGAEERRLKAVPEQQPDHQDHQQHTDNA